MAQIESEMDVSSSYFVQIRSNAYNALSLKNVLMLQEISRQGHHIGLHYHIGNSMEPMFVKREIEEQCRMLQSILQITIDRYSMHRPQKETLYYETDISGLINAYGSDFFTYSEEIDDTPILNVKYISDAKHRWNYGTPDLQTMQKEPKIQLLVHPDFWSDHSPEMQDNFAELIREHALNFTETIDNECHHFKEYRQYFEKMVL